MRKRRLGKRQPGEVGAAELEHARTEPEASPVSPYVAELRQRQQKSSRGRAGQPGLGGNLTRCCGFAAVEGTNDGKAALERLDERGAAVPGGHAAGVCRGGSRDQPAGGDDAGGTLAMP